MIQNEAVTAEKRIKVVIFAEEFLIGCRLDCGSSTFWCEKARLPSRYPLWATNDSIGAVLTEELPKSGHFVQKFKFGRGSGYGNLGIMTETRFARWTMQVEPPTSSIGTVSSEFRFHQKWPFWAVTDNFYYNTVSSSSIQPILFDPSSSWVCTDCCE